MNLTFTNNPSLNQFLEIKQWLKDEYDSLNKGFYTAWEHIENSFQKERLIIAAENNSSVGFLTFSISSSIAEVSVCEVKPDKRRKGIAKNLLKFSSDYFLREGALVIQLFCFSVESEPIWKKLGFVNFPEGVTKEPRTYLYKILVGTLPFSVNNATNESIELWDKDDHLADRFEPHWRWKIKNQNNSNRLLLPIIHPTSYEWPVRLSHQSSKSFIYLISS